MYLQVFAWAIGGFISLDFLVEGVHRDFRIGNLTPNLRVGKCCINFFGLKLLRNGVEILGDK